MFVNVCGFGCVKVWECVTVCVCGCILHLAALFWLNGVFAIVAVSGGLHHVIDPHLLH